MDLISIEFMHQSQDICEIYGKHEIKKNKIFASQRFKKILPAAGEDWTMNVVV